MTNVSNTASPKPVSWSGPTSYESGCCTIEAKILCIGGNLGRYQTWDRAAGVGVEIEPGSLALLESEKCGARDHRRVVGRETRTRREDSHTLRVKSRSHRCGESAVAGDTAAEYYTLPGKRIRGAPRLLDEGIDQRILECAGDVGFVGFDVRRGVDRVEHAGLEAAEREGVITVVPRQRVLSHHRSREVKSLWITIAGKLFDVATAGIWKTKELGDLVECFAGGVVASCSQQPVFAP